MEGPYNGNLFQVSLRNDLSAMTNQTALLYPAFPKCSRDMLVYPFSTLSSAPRVLGHKSAAQVSQHTFACCMLRVAVLRA